MEENKKVEEIIDETTNLEVEEEIGNTEEEKSSDVNEETAKETTIEDELNAIRNLKDENKKLSNQLKALEDRLLRVSAEYENHRKRTIKEKEGIYADACLDILKEMIPTLDNLERAIAVEGSVEDLKKGIDMTIKGFKGSFEKLGVEEIDTTLGFDPNLHQAVMHIQDEALEANSIAEVFQKGYKKGDKVIRYTMVKVAN